MNYIENFFYISLAITFILILLLVYHFKQRLVSLENKSDTMFEIINNIVKELSLLKSVVINIETHNKAPMYKEEPIYNVEPVHTMQRKNGYVIDEEYESDDESILYTGEDEDISYIEEKYDEVNTDKDEDISYTEEQYDNNIKKINVNEEDMKVHEEDIKVQEEDMKVQEDEDNEIKQEIQDQLSEQVSNNDENDNISEIEEENTEESIHINKLEETIEIPENNNQNSDDKESFKRMTIQQLKALVISKGLATDTNKLKKNDLIRLLENMD